MKSDLAKRLDPAPKSPDWLGFAPAKLKEIRATEERLGLELPPSYKAFLRTSNGWGRTTAFIGRIRPCAEVELFSVENEQWAAIYSEVDVPTPDEDYFNYGEEGAENCRAAHFASLLQISDVEDGVYLLNPEVVTPDGEWEAWFFANWVPGAVRLPSFAHLMLRQYRSFGSVENIELSAQALPELAIPAPDLPRSRAESTIRKPAAKGIESLIDGMRAPDNVIREKAVRTFCGKLKGRARAERRPDLIETLTELFMTSRDASVRSACVQALTEMAEEGSAPPPLFDALSDPDPSVVLSGIFALMYFPNKRALEPLCKFIDSGVNPLFSENAMRQLGMMGDDRAVPTLQRVLLNTANTFDQNFGKAGIALSRCGPRGVDALIAAVSHPDARVRRAVAVGLDVSGDPRAKPLLDKLENDPDPQVRKRAAMRLGKRDW